MQAENEKQLKLKENRKIIRNRINEYYDTYANELIQSATTYDKYRKVVYEVIENFISVEVMGEHQEYQADHQN